MTKKIKCTSCGRDCGEIRDASLLKNLRFICWPCDSLLKSKIDQQKSEFKAYSEAFNYRSK